MNWYIEDLNCTAETTKILIKEKDDKYFIYKPIKKIIKLLEANKELYSFNPKVQLNKIHKIEFLGIQEFFKISTFSGSRILLGKDAEIFVDGDWIKVFELRFHEKIYEYNLIRELYLDTFITDIAYYGKGKGYRVIFEDENGIIMNNLMIRFPAKKQTVEASEVPESPS
jgi:hypothetical protein